MERAKGFQTLTKVEDALRIFLGAIGEPRLKIDYAPIEKALGRSLAVDVTARHYLPIADVSIMDGYAVRSEDIESAS